MGGWASALGDVFSKAGAAATEKLRSTELGSMAQDFLRSQRTEFMRGTPEGTSILGKYDQYTALKEQLLKKYITPINGLKEGIKDTHDMSQNLVTLHGQLPANHPARAFSTQLMQDASNAPKTLETLNREAMYKASKEAQLSVFGQNNENLADDLMSLFSSADPKMHSHANAILDILANQFRDTEINDEGVPISRTKADVKNEMYKENVVRRGMGQGPLPYSPERLSIKSVYERQNALEKAVSLRTRIFLAPFVAINHMGTLFNYAWAPLTAIGKTLGDLSNPQMAQQVEAAGIFNSLLHSSIDEDLRSSTGFIASKTQPRIGRLFGQVFHNPGFSQIRKMQLRVGGILGYHSAQHWAAEAMQGDKRAILELREMGIDVADLQRRGGQLTPDELQSAMFHFTNNRAFINRSMDRSLAGTKNPWMRMLTMFHGYVTSQQQFVRREFQKMLDAGDYAGIARIAGTMGLVFPAVAPLIKSAELMARSASVSQGMSSLQQDYETLGHPEDTGKFMSEYLDLLSYFGTWGTLHSYLNAAHHDRLALAAMGPVYGSGVRAAQDVLNFAFFPGKKGRNIRPLAEDVLQQTVPGLGEIAASKLYPSKKKRSQE